MGGAYEEKGRSLWVEPRRDNTKQGELDRGAKEAYHNHQEGYGDRG